MTKPEKTKPGRPEGKAFPHVRSLRFSDKDAERLEKLAEKLEVTEVQVVRTAVRRLADAEGIDLEGAE